MVKNAGIIGDEVARITKIIRQVLDFSRSRGPTLTRVHLGAVVGRGAGVPARDDPPAGDRPSTCSTMPAPPEVPGDPDQIQQVCLNLITNAIHAMPNGGTLRIATERVVRRKGGLDLAPPAEYAVLIVADSGPGIPAADRDKIFEPFFTTKDAGQGTGLGLAVSHGIVKDHDGWIEVDSPAAGGAVFRVYLPCAAAAGAAAETADGFARDPTLAEAKIDRQGLNWTLAAPAWLKPHTPPSPRAPPATSGGGRATILVVEDDTAMRTMLREALEEDGYTVEVAAGGRAGVERVRQGGIDLVVSDVKMPDLDGLDMLREIKAVSPSPHVITITAFGSIDTAIRAVKLGAFDYITKPFDVDQLILSVQKALAERALRSEVARLRDEVQRSYRWGNIVGTSAPMQEVFALIRRLSGSASSVLVTGASGTGKELVAKAIHFNSPRRDRPFVAHQLRRHPRHAARERAVRLQARRLHRRAHRSGRHLRRGRRRDDLPRRDRRAVAGAAGQAAARAAGGGDPAARRGAQREDRRARGGRDQQGSGGAPVERRLPRGSLLPAERAPHPPAGAARSPGGHPAARGAFPGAQRGQGGQGDPRRFTSRRRRRCCGYGWPGNVRELENVVERAVALTEGSLVREDDLPAVVRERRAATRTRTISARRWRAG